MKTKRTDKFKKTLGIYPDAFFIPKTAQNVIPVKAVFEDGIFLVGKNKFSMTYQLTDINYTAAGEDDKKSVFFAHSDVLNSASNGAAYKFNVIDRYIDKQEFKDNVLIPYKNDGLNYLRDDFNKVLTDKVTSSNYIVQDRYVTVTIEKKSIEEARIHFKRIQADISSKYSRIGVKITAVTGAERLKIIHNILLPEDKDFHIDLQEKKKRGHSPIDSICPNSFEFKGDYFKIGNRFARVLFLQEYPSFIKDSVIKDLTETNPDLMLSIDYIGISTNEAAKLVQKLLLGSEKNIEEDRRKRAGRGDYLASVPWYLEQEHSELLDALNDIQNRDQKLFFAVISILHTADTLEKLNADTAELLSIAEGNHLCKFETLSFRQLQGLQTVLPFGVNYLENTTRTLTTESLAVFMPFNVQDIMNKGGLYCGENAISGNLIICDKKQLKNPNSFIFGVPGSGKSFWAKLMIILIALLTDDDIMIADPEGEYTELVKALKGTVIDISANSTDYINPMEMVEGYGESKNPVVDKTQFILSMLEQMDSRHPIDGTEKSVISRCVSNVYAEAKLSGETPVLENLYRELLKQPEEQAKSIALRLELYAVGNFDVFAHQTNTNVDSRIISYNIYNLGEHLKDLGLHIITDFILNRVADNWRRGRKTHIFIDEFHIMFKSEKSAEFCDSAWRQFRKRNGYPTAITQNVETILDSTLASSMLSNSEFVVMLNQSMTDRQKLEKLLNLSEEEMSFVTNSDVGCGLLKYGSSIVPFINHFPKDSKIYKLINTNPNEK